MNQIPIAFLKSGECLSLRVIGLMTKTYFYVVWLELTSEIFEALENKGMFGDYFLFFCFLKLVFGCFENCNKKQYYNRFENKKFVWHVFFT